MWAFPPQCLRTDEAGEDLVRCGPLLVILQASALEPSHGVGEAAAVVVGLEMRVVIARPKRSGQHAAVR